MPGVSSMLIELPIWTVDRIEAIARKEKKPYYKVVENLIIKAVGPEFRESTFTSKEGKVMKLRHLAPNMTELQMGDAKRILFSYETPVAGFHPEYGYFQTLTKYSKTTKAHINKYGCQNARYVPQIWIDDIVNGIDNPLP